MWTQTENSKSGIINSLAMSLVNIFFLMNLSLIILAQKLWLDKPKVQVYFTRVPSCYQVEQESSFIKTTREIMFYEALNCFSIIFFWRKYLRYLKIKTHSSSF